MPGNYYLVRTPVVSNHSNTKGSFILPELQSAFPWAALRQNMIFLGNSKDLLFFPNYWKGRADSGTHLHHRRRGINLAEPLRQ